MKGYYYAYITIVFVKHIGLTSGGQKYWMRTNT